MEDWLQIKTWRRERRDELLGQRAHLPREARHQAQAQIIASLKTYLTKQSASCIGFYWPFKGEIDLRALVSELLQDSAQAALPVVVEKAQPLEFWRWHSGMAMRPGIWRIPVPEQRNPVQPDLLLIPLVGFDASGYRLGYGGGYYDRTLAAMTTRPRKIGVGHDLGRLSTIHPQEHDIPMDTIITERGISEFPG